MAEELCGHDTVSIIFLMQPRFFLIESLFNIFGVRMVSFVMMLVCVVGLTKVEIFGGGAAVGGRDTSGSRATAGGRATTAQGRDNRGR